MLPRDLGLIACRLLALYVLYGLAVNLAFAFSYYLQVPAVSDVFGVSMVSHAYGDAASLVVNLAVVLVLWFCAGWLAGTVAPETAEAPEETPRAWSHRDAFSIAVVVLGLSVLISYLPAFVSHLPLILRSAAVQDGTNAPLFLDLRSLISSLLTIVLGLLCVLRPGSIVEAIARLRRW